MVVCHNVLFRSRQLHYRRSVFHPQTWLVPSYVPFGSHGEIKSPEIRWRLCQLHSSLWLGDGGTGMTNRTRSTGPRTFIHVHSHVYLFICTYKRHKSTRTHTRVHTHQHTNTCMQIPTYSYTQTLTCIYKTFLLRYISSLSNTRIQTHI